MGGVVCVLGGKEMVKSWLVSSLWCGGLGEGLGEVLCEGLGECLGEGLGEGWGEGLGEGCGGACVRSFVCVFGGKMVRSWLVTSW